MTLTAAEQELCKNIKGLFDIISQTFDEIILCNIVS